MDYVAHYGGLFLFAAWVVLLQWSYSDDWPRTFSDPKNALFYTGCGIFVAYLFLKNISRPLALFNIPLIVLFLYIIVAACTITFSPTGWYEGLLEIARLLLWSGLVWGISTLDIKSVKYIGAISVCSASIIALLNMIQLYGVSTWPKEDDVIFPIGNYTYYGDFMVLHIPICLYFMGVVGKSSPRKRGSL